MFVSRRNLSIIRDTSRVNPLIKNYSRQTYIIILRRYLLGTDDDGRQTRELRYHYNTH